MKKFKKRRLFILDIEGKLFNKKQKNIEQKRFEAAQKAAMDIIKKDQNMKETQRLPHAIEEKEAALKMAMDIIKNDQEMRKTQRLDREVAATSTCYDATREAYITLSADDTPPEPYTYKLLKLAGNYGFSHYIEIDLRNGQPYFVHEEYRYEGHFGWITQRFSQKITFEMLRKMASSAGKGKEYMGINQSNWKDYIPEKDIAKIK